MKKIANVTIQYVIDDNNKLFVDGFLTRASADKLAVRYLELLDAENIADDEVTAAASPDSSQTEPSENATS